MLGRSASELMAIPIVSPDKCPLCIGDARLEGICDVHFMRLGAEFEMQGELMYGVDEHGRRWLDQIPDDPSRN